MPAEAVIGFTLKHLRRMFPNLTDDRMTGALGVAQSGRREGDPHA